MKITRLSFQNHPIFGNHSIELGSNANMTFLVGNNGSGKTRILDAIYRSLSGQGGDKSVHRIDLHILLSPEEQARAKLSINEVIYRVNYNSGGSHISSLDNSEVHLSVDLRDFFKIVFSTVEINFAGSTIQSVTSKNIDDQNMPKGKSENLSTEIPQLLIDISNLDDSEIARWFDGIKGQPYIGNIPDNIGTRLQRFTDAFHRIYDGSKTFSAIKNINNQKEIIFKDSNNIEVGLNDLSTGEKQIIYRIGYILKNIGNINGGIILIDEPEISLHPVWQLRLKDFLHEVFDPFNVQIIIATHSPYIFKNLDETREQCLKIDRSNPESRKVSLAFPRVCFNPTINLITYLAYGIVSELLHIELYTLLQIREGRDKINNSPGNDDGIENWLREPTGGNVLIRQTFVKTGKTTPTSESIMTWIRNKIHHPDEIARPPYTQQDLKESIDTMINLLKNP